MDGDNILVTGGTGFLGDELIRRLCKDTQAHLWVLSRASKDGTAAERILRRLDRRFHERVTVLEGDLGRPLLGIDPAGDSEPARQLRRLLDCCNEVFHNAADLSFRSEPAIVARVMDTNVGGTARLLDLARQFRRPLKAFNFTSTAYVHGTWPADRVFREDDRPTGWRNAYEESKWQAERLVADSGLPCRIFRPSIIVTEPEATILSYDGMYTIGDALAKGRDLYRRRVPDGHLSLEIIADPDSEQNFVLRRDVVDMMMRLRAAPGTTGRAFHLVTPSNTRLEYMFDAIAETLGFSYTFVDRVVTRNPVSHLFKRTVLPAYEGYLFNGCPILDQSNVRSALGDAYVDATITRIDAGWMKTLFRDYFDRRGVVEEPVPAVAVAEPVAEREAVAALVEDGWDNMVRVRLIGEYRTSDRRVNLWRVRVPVESE
ncbi:MAG TPA: SDR family oxidoreductase [Vicinamibacterales bacterium]